MFIPFTVVRNKTRGSWSICLYHKDSKRRYWIDIRLDTSVNDFTIDWNQYIFYQTDSDDMERKAFQENPANAAAAFGIVIDTLEDEHEVFQGTDGGWYLKPKLWEAKTWNI